MSVNTVFRATQPPPVRTPATAGVVQTSPGFVLPTTFKKYAGKIKEKADLAKLTAQYRPPRAGKDRVFRRKIEASGCLRSISHATEAISSFLLGSEYVSNAVVISFPSMPETIELIRETDYKVTSGSFLPDGLHMYKGTAPLSIPFSFSLHAMDDEYCENGSLTLLQIAARLHSLTLPIQTTQQRVSVVAETRGELADLKVQQDAAEAAQKKTDKASTFIDSLKSVGTAIAPMGVGSTSSDVVTDKRAAEPLDVTVRGVTNPPSFPVACKLDLIYTGQDSPGISAIGYVKSVKVVLKGPWLRSNNGRGLPTSAEYSFIFMHHPSHTNQFNNTGVNLTADGTFVLPSQNGAFADDVKNNLYNSIGLLSGNETYTGFRT